MKTEMKENKIRELDFNEIEQVNAGCPLCLAFLGGQVVMYGGIAALGYLYYKSRK